MSKVDTSSGTSRLQDDKHLNRFIHIKADNTSSFEDHKQCATCHPEMTFVSNYISTTKYFNALTFIFQNLFEQFQKKANLYFLIIACISLTPLSPKTPIVSIAPLVFVLGVSAVKEAIEDYARYKMDQDVNGRQIQVHRSGNWTSIPWKDVKVGDLLWIPVGSEFACDVILLKTSHVTGSCTIETSNLDGETNLKVKQAKPETYGIECSEAGKDYVSNLPPCIFESSAPNKKMNSSSWTGTLTWVDSQKDKIPLGYQQLLLRGCALRGTKWVLGVAVFTGTETKLMLNNKPAPFKRSNIDLMVDKALYVLFTLQFSLCTFGAIMNFVWMDTNGLDNWYLPYSYEDTDYGNEAALSWFTYLVLIDILIPISLYVSMELVKLTQARLISWDLDMYHEATDTPAQARTSNLNEELGQVEYIFSDKTGTLTCNIMNFNACSVAGRSYGLQDEKTRDSREETPPFPPIGIPPTDSDFPFHDWRLLRKILNSSDPNHLAPSFETTLMLDSKDNPVIDSYPSEQVMINEFFTLLCVNHTVMTEFPGCKEDHIIHRHGDCKVPVLYQAASPDEKALVIAAKNHQYYFYDREPCEIKVGEHIINGEKMYINIKGQDLEFEFIEKFKFNSSRARMSVIVRDPRDGIIKVYTKGADSKMRWLLNDHSVTHTWSKCSAHLSEFAKTGLRTLVCAYKTLDEDVFCEWWTRHKAAKASMRNRVEAVDQSMNEIENELILLGSTAIEDELQDGVPDTIATLARAGIKIWVLTGDKVETAINIGLSCKLLTEPMMSRGLILLTIDDDAAEEEAYKSALQLIQRAKEITSQEEGNQVDNLAVVVSGRCLGFVFPPPRKDKKGRVIKDSARDPQELAAERQLQLDFLQICQKCKAVVCCRVSPLQKAQVVTLVKENVNDAITLAIGDGANDVPMIKSAHVGIGISGLEGLQAVMSSDYSIAQFRFLEKLLLVHGSQSYRRISLLILYSFYKNIAVSMTLIWFAFISGFSAQLFFDAYAGSCYNMIFTAFPIMLACVFNVDVSPERLLAYPELYKANQRQGSFSLMHLLYVICEALFHSVILFAFAIYTYGTVTRSDGQDNDMWMGSTAMFSCVVMTVTFRVGLDSQSWNWVTVVFLVASILSWFLFAIVYCQFLWLTPDMYNVAQRLFMESTFWLLLFVSIAACMVPVVAVRYYRRTYYPTLNDVVMEIDRGYCPANAENWRHMEDGAVSPVKRSDAVGIETDTSLLNQPTTNKSSSVVENRTAAHLIPQAISTTSDATRVIVGSGVNGEKA